MVCWALVLVLGASTFFSARNAAGLVLSIAPFFGLQGAVGRRYACEVEYVIERLPTAGIFSASFQVSDTLGSWKKENQ